MGDGKMEPSGKYQLEQEGSAQILCLVIDIVSSATKAKKRTAEGNRKFYKSLVLQIYPHLEELDLLEASETLKFTGDGWMIMSGANENKAVALCCLALIMRHNFKSEMTKLTGRSESLSLRITICSGHDFKLGIPIGGGGSQMADWVGDSARRAVRLQDCVKEGKNTNNHVYIDYGVNDMVKSYFTFVPSPFSLRSKAFKRLLSEEAVDGGNAVYPVFKVKGIHKKSISVNKYFEYTLVTLKRTEKKKTYKTIFAKVKKEASPDTVTYTKLIKGAPNFLTALELFKEMKKTPGATPNTVTYNTLINRAPNFLTAHGFFEEMKKTPGATPDTVTYNTLINGAPDFPTALELFKEMKKTPGATPNTVTYSTLIKRAPDFPTALELFKEMKKTPGATPNTVTLTTLFSKDLTGHEAPEMLLWYLAQPNPTDAPIQAMISSFRKLRQDEDVYFLILQYPHLQISGSIMKKKREDIIPYFEKAYEAPDGKGNAAYALGVAYFHYSEFLLAKKYLEEALNCMPSKGRMEGIDKMIGIIKNLGQY